MTSGSPDDAQIAETRLLFGAMKVPRL